MGTLFLREALAFLAWSMLGTSGHTVAGWLHEEALEKVSPGAATQPFLTWEHICPPQIIQVLLLLPLLLLVLIVEGTVLLVLVSILNRVIQCEDVLFLPGVVASRE